VEARNAASCECVGVDEARPVELAGTPKPPAVIASSLQILQPEARVHAVLQHTSHKGLLHVMQAKACLANNFVTPRSDQSCPRVLRGWQPGTLAASHSLTPAGPMLPVHCVRSLEMRLLLIKQVLTGLEHVHACDLAHIDLKPGNMLLLEALDGRDAATVDTAVGDLGLARAVGTLLLQPHGTAGVVAIKEPSRVYLDGIPHSPSSHRASSSSRQRHRCMQRCSRPLARGRCVSCRPKPAWWKTLSPRRSHGLPWNTAGLAAWQTGWIATNSTTVLHSRRLMLPRPLDACMRCKSRRLSVRAPQA
jgi:serine/threonine protein kinase